MSIYAPAWEKLKKDRIVILTISNPDHAQRIIKAIRKRKDLDTPYREQLRLDRVRYKLTGALSENGKLLTIKLVKRTDASSV